MGEVWLAQDERLQEPVARKFLPAEIQRPWMICAAKRHADIGQCCQIGQAKFCRF